MPNRVKDFNDFAVSLGLDRASRAMREFTQWKKEEGLRDRFSKLGMLSICELRRQFPDLREPIIEGLLRRGETCTLISSSKAKKTWLRDHLALSLATQRGWMNFGTPLENCRVVILDNELDEGLLSWRINKVAVKMGIDIDRIRDRITYWPIRGKLQNIIQIRDMFCANFRPGEIDFLIIDALYRTIPKEWRENDNTDMAHMFNNLDAISEHLACGIMGIHHASKGSQFGKAITDVGAGAGAMTRSVFSHLILREHENDQMVIMEGVARSFEDIEPRVLEWDFPTWEVKEREPIAYKGGSDGNRSAAQTSNLPDWEKDERKTIEEKARAFVEQFVPLTGSRPRMEIEEMARRFSLSARKVKLYLNKAKDSGDVYEKYAPRSGGKLYSRNPFETEETQDEQADEDAPSGQPHSSEVDGERYEESNE